jgi:hypothetical protein
MKRTPMVRKTPLRSKPADGPPSRKPVRCKAPGCKERFIRRSMSHRACSGECAQKLVAYERGLELERAARVDRKQTRAQLEAMKTRRDLEKEVQTAFHKFVRLRDRLKPCICCGKPLGEQRFGGAYDAGHYLSRGSHPNLRFSEVNTNGQRKSCNRPGGATAAAFRIGMIERYGLEVVEALEADKSPRKYDKDELRRMRAHYRAICLVLEKAANDEEMVDDRRVA